ncbi:ribosome silencing factor [Aquabacter sp. CN5-332]|uniref:ribosome silencing factor n=1 Tax=Aquabacter sp. CN5-332 TaxID=3156608 RepID=UPI0032B58BBD
MAPAPVSQAQLDAEEILALVLARLDDDKSDDIVSIDLRGKTSIADYMVVASGRSQRHVGAIAEHLIEGLKAAGIKQVRVEGQPACDWVLIDANDVIVHVFQPEVRSFYNIEKMWSGTARA